MEAGGLSAGGAGERGEQGRALWRRVGTDPCKALWAEVGMLGGEEDEYGLRGEADAVVQGVEVENQGHIREFSRQ